MVLKTKRKNFSDSKYFNSRLHDFLTDGHSTINEGGVLSEAANTRRAGIDIYSVAIGNDVNVGELGAIASDPDSSFVINLRNSNEIDSASDRLLDQLCA